MNSDRSEWIPLQLKLPHPTAGGGAVYLNRELYIFGGIRKPRALFKLNKNMKWIQLADMNFEREWITHSSLEWNGYIWVFGGYNSEEGTLKSVERYDPIEDTWDEMP